jgi:hypothetical protein
MKARCNTREWPRNAWFAIAFATAVFFASSCAESATVRSIASGRPGLSVILIEGRLDGGETLSLEALVSKLPLSTTIAVVLNSPGGALFEGMKLGRFFHQARIPTFVLGYGGVCASACAIAFLGGRDRDGRPSRTKMFNSNLGFHQFRRDHGTDPNKKFSKANIEQEVLYTRATALEIIKYLSDIGEEMSFLHLMLKAPEADITLLSNEDAVTYGIHVMDERNEQIIDSGGIKARVEAR